MSAPPRAGDPLAAAGARLAASHASIAQALLPAEPPAGPRGGPAEPAALAPGLLVTLAGAAIQPVAQRHPWLLVGGAAALGAALVTRPWRRAIGTVLMAAVLTPAAGRWALREATRVLIRPLHTNQPPP